MTAPGEKAARIAEMRAYTLLYGLERLSALGKGFILHQSTRGRWLASIKIGGREVTARNWETPTACIRALLDAAEGR